MEDSNISQSPDSNVPRLTPRLAVLCVLGRCKSNNEGEDWKAQLEFGGTLDESNNEDETAHELLDAATDGRGEDVMRILTKNPEFIRIGDANGDTPLHAVIKAGHWKTAWMMIKFLKKHHCKLLREVVYQVNAEGDTLDVLAFSAPITLNVDIEMRIAVDELNDDEDNEEDEIQKMLQKKEDEDSCNAFHQAALSGEQGTLEKMVKVTEKSRTKLLLLQKDENGNTPLQLAINGSHENAARYLFKVVPSAIYQVNKQGHSPLVLAVKRGCVDLVRYMVGPKLPPSERKSLLQHAVLVSLAHVAIRTRNLAMLKAVMEGLPHLINSRDRLGWRPLSYAASKGYVDEVSYILETFPGSTRQPDKDGSFPVHKAVAGGDKGVVNKFLSHCPEALYDVDIKGRNVIDIATRYDRNDILLYLEHEIQSRGQGISKGHTKE